MFFGRFLSFYSSHSLCHKIGTIYNLITERSFFLILILFLSNKKLRIRYWIIIGQWLSFRPNFQESQWQIKNSYQ